MAASTNRGDAIPRAMVYRSAGIRTFMEQSNDPGYDLPRHLFEAWWLQWFWNKDLLCEVPYRDAGMSLLFMAAMVEAGDA